MKEYTITELPLTGSGATVLKQLAKDITEAILKTGIEIPAVIDYSSNALQGRLLRMFGRILQHKEACQESILIGSVNETDRMSTLHYHIAHNNNPGIIIYTTSQRFFTTPEDIPEEANLRAIPALEEYLKTKGPAHLKAYMLRKTLVVETKLDLTTEQLFTVICTYINIFEKEGYGEVPKELKAFFEGLLKNDVQQVNEHINELINPQELRERKFQRLENVFTGVLSRKEQELKEKIQTATVQYQNYLDILARMQRELKEYKTMYAGLKDEAVEIDQTAIIDFLVKNPYIDDIEIITSSKIAVFYKAPIKYFEKNIMDVLLEKKPDNGFLKILKQDKYELWTECLLTINTTDFSVTPERDAEKESYIGHPHLDEYGCVGNHPEEITEWINNNDYLGAFEQISYMVMELNLADPYVFSTLCDRLKYDYPTLKTFMNKETKEFASYEEILKEINDEESTINE